MAGTHTNTWKPPGTDLSLTGWCHRNRAVCLSGLRAENPKIAAKAGLELLITFYFHIHFKNLASNHIKRNCLTSWKTFFPPASAPGKHHSIRARDLHSYKGGLFALSPTLWDKRKFNFRCNRRRKKTWDKCKQRRLYLNSKTSINWLTRRCEREYFLFDLT